MVRKARGTYKRSASTKDGKILCIRTEGEETELSYLRALCRKLSISWHRVNCKEAKGTDPLSVVSELVKEKQRNKKSKDAAKIDSFWAVIDTEVDRPKLKEAIDLARKNDINLAISHPSFEYWLILHFKKRARMYSSPKEVENDLKTILPSYEKTLTNAAQIVELYEVALKNVSLLRNEQRNIGDSDLACTTFDELVLELVRMSSTKNRQNVL